MKTKMNEQVVVAFFNK